MDAELGGSLGLLVAYALIALGFSFLCSIVEAVLLSITPSYIATLAEERPRRAASLEKLKADIDRPLAAILSLNTIAHTVGAVGVGAEASAIWGSTGIGVASAIMTVLILILSEIIPKTIGATYWRGLAPSVAPILTFLVKAFLPLVWISEIITRLIGRGERNDVVTPQEVAAMAGLSAESGEMPAEQTRVVKNLIALDSLTVKDIMTPRTVIIAFPQEMTVTQLLDDHPNLPVSRLPIYDGSIDKVTGFVLKSDVLLAQAQDKHDTTLKELRRNIRAIPANASLSEMFAFVLREQEHLALVIDEYGGTDGLVTAEDMIETLLGIEIVDEADVAEDMQRLARRQWQHRAKTLGIDVAPTDAQRRASQQGTT